MHARRTTRWGRGSPTIAAARAAPTNKVLERRRNAAPSRTSSGCRARWWSRAFPHGASSAERREVAPQRFDVGRTAAVQMVDEARDDLLRFQLVQVTNVAVQHVLTVQRPGDLGLFVVLAELGEVDDAKLLAVARFAIDLEHRAIGNHGHLGLATRSSGLTGASIAAPERRANRAVGRRGASGRARRERLDHRVRVDALSP